MLQSATAAVQDFTAKVDWEKVANAITQSFDTAVNAVTALADTIETLAPIIAVAAGAFASLKAGMEIQHLVQGFQNAQVSISLLTMGLKDTTLAQAALNGTMTVGETIVALLTGKMTLAQLAQAAMTKGQIALNAALTANPIGAVIAVVVHWSPRSLSYGIQMRISEMRSSPHGRKSKKPFPARWLQSKRFLRRLSRMRRRRRLTGSATFRSR